MKARPVLYVLAGVNGAGKSSIGGGLLERAGLTWFNPDTFARELVAETGCAGVVVGRGCLGRPWLFGDLGRAFAGLPVPAAPPLADVVAVLRRHAHLLAEWLTEPAHRNRAHLKKACVKMWNTAGSQAPAPRPSIM